MPRLLLGLIVAIVAGSVAVCNSINPYACPSYYRSATYTGLLGQSIPPDSSRDSGHPGRVVFLLNEWTGTEPQQGVNALVNFRGFVPAVSESHVHEGTPAHPGRILWKSGVAMQSDSIWMTGSDLFHGPAAWQDIWNLLAAGHAYFEIHSASGDSVSAGLLKVDTIPFVTACT